MIVMLDKSGNQFFVNDSCKHILGYEPEELINIDVIGTMIHPDDKDKVKSAFLDVIKGKAHGDIQYRHRHKNGGWKYLEAVGNNLLSVPSIQAIVLNVRDVTERIKAEKRLKESERSLEELNANKDKFLSIIAHDLRTPLSTIIGFSELLPDLLKDGNIEQAESFTSIIHQSTLQMSELLNNLLVWARNQSGRIDYTPEELIINELIEETIKLENESAFQKSIDISYSSSEIISLKGDKNMLSTVMRNLISNGIKFTPENGSIEINTKLQDQEVLVSVSDNGMGIPQNKIDTLFQIEHSKSTDGTNGEKGSGLGLLLCKDFIQNHGGRIWAKNNPGKGATFYFTVPIN